ncbi:MAG: Cys-tRNA(Pro) deacylase [Deltaproteobacteria bacterium HGW-Deltaproteobacteria-4]|nr:MAG: Cys-tRNA(Pro) deacylase [Deltaproteobacteria bacterium HGW-Deltaproteobacteria-4]
MAKEKFPVTAAIRALREGKIPFTEHLYPYEEKGGTATSARELGVDEHCVIKTLIMEDDKKEPLIILMHGDCQVSTKELARQIGARSVIPSSPEAANRHTGYLVGGTSPFGTRRPLSVYVEASILELERIYINGGKRGFLVALAPQDLVNLLKPTPVTVAIDG